MLGALGPIYGTLVTSIWQSPWAAASATALMWLGMLGAIVFALVRSRPAGLLRFPDSYTRLHALTKADNLGLGLIVVGLLPQVDGVAGGLKLVFIWLLVLLSGGTASQLVARALRKSPKDDR